jgi:hypothetical protein
MRSRSSVVSVTSALPRFKRLAHDLFIEAWAIGFGRIEEGDASVKGEAFAVDASVMEADASRYHGKAPDEIDRSAPERQTRAVAEFLGALDDEDPDADRKVPKAISPVDPCSAWTAKANKRVQFGYGLNYLIDIEYAIVVDVEATPARTYAVEVCGGGHGAQGRDRTTDTAIFSRMLYQLSYLGVPCA